MTYPGGKGRAFQQLINLMPPHDMYVETHLGGGALLLRKHPARRSVGIDLDPDVIARWREVGLGGLEVRHGDAVEELDGLDLSADALVFCDPPYWPGARRRKRCYRYDYSVADHEQLVHAIRRLSCRVMLAGYRNRLYDEVLSDWHTTEIRNSTQTGLVTETVWSNYPPPYALHDYDYAGSCFRTREALKRRRKNHVLKLQRAGQIERNAILADLAEAFPNEFLAALHRQNMIRSPVQPQLPMGAYPPGHEPGWPVAEEFGGN